MPRHARAETVSLVRLDMLRRSQATRHHAMVVRVSTPRCLGIFCASTLGHEPAFADAARALVRACAAHDVSIVYGGAKVGLMGVVGDEALAGGVHVTGVITHGLVKREVAHTTLDASHVVETMHERKTRMAELAGAFVALPGAIGTMEEIFEQWTWRWLGIHDKPIAFLDTDGYWTPMLDAIAGMEKRGIVRAAHRAIPIVERDPVVLVERLFARRQSEQTI
jgi:uncharacterized protein (TIGR00730 family)